MIGSFSKGLFLLDFFIMLYVILGGTLFYYKTLVFVQFLLF